MTPKINGLQAFDFSVSGIGAMAVDRQLHLHLQAQITYGIEIYDVQGNKFWSKTVSHKNLVSLKNLSLGFYFLKVTPTGEKPQVFKVNLF